MADAAASRVWVVEGLGRRDELDDQVRGLGEERWVSGPRSRGRGPEAGGGADYCPAGVGWGEVQSAGARVVIVISSERSPWPPSLIAWTV